MRMAITRSISPTRLTQRNLTCTGRRRAHDTRQCVVSISANAERSGCLDRRIDIDGRLNKMTGRRIRADYDALDEIAKSFDREAEARNDHRTIMPPHDKATDQQAVAGERGGCAGSMPVRQRDNSGPSDYGFIYPRR